MDAALIERFGTLGILIVGISYTMRWLATKVVEPLVSSHTGLVEQLKSSDARQTELLDRQADTIDRQATTLATIAETQREICQILDTMKTK